MEVEQKIYIKAFVYSKLLTSLARFLKTRDLVINVLQGETTASVFKTCAPVTWAMDLEEFGAENHGLETKIQKEV